MSHCPSCGKTVHDDAGGGECLMCGHTWGDCRPQAAVVDENLIPCAGCSNKIDVSLRKDNPTCDQCNHEAYINEAYWALIGKVKAMKLPFELSIEVKFSVSKSRQTSVMESRCVASLTNNDAGVNVVGLGRTAKAACDGALKELETSLAAMRKLFAAA